MITITIDAACCKGCKICLMVCPKKVFIKSKARNNYGTAMPGVNRPENCVHCGMCERLCPDGAISVKGDAEDEAKC